MTFEEQVLILLREIHAMVTAIHAGTDRRIK